jgi:hypothetical protein
MPRGSSAAGAAILCAVVSILPSPAHAGAWVQDKGRWLVITSLDVSRASAGYDAHGRPDVPLLFYKYYAKSLIEYGWSSRLTLFVAPEYVIGGQTLPNRKPFTANDFGVEGGARYHLSDAFGVLSVQSSFKFAGPFDLANSVGQDSAYVGEVRVLDGAGFTLFGDDGFANGEVAQRFISRPRPNETVLDLTAGLWINPKTMVMVQSFNTVGWSDGEPPYTSYRMHKLEASLVQHLWGRWFLQSGAYISPAGQNSLVEQGVVTAVWARF